MVLTGKHTRLIRYALRRAGQAPKGQQHRLGCVLVKGGTPISSGVNNMAKTHPMAIKYAYPYLHAELAALIGVEADEIEGSVAYVARKKARGPGMAKPCECCEALMRKMGVKGVYYTIENGVEYMDLR